MTDRGGEKVRQADGLRRTLGDKRIGLDAGVLGDGVLHQPMHTNDIRALQFRASAQLLQRINAMMEKEFEIEQIHVAARVAGAGRVQAHRRKRVGETAIDALDGVERKLPLRHFLVGEIGEHRIALKIGQRDRRDDLGKDALE